VQSRWSFRKRSTWALIAAPALVLASLSVAAASAATGHAGIPAGSTAARILLPHKVNNLDCNGWSRKYRALIPGHRMFCADPHGAYSSDVYYSASSGSAKASAPYVHRFTDNGHYVGHDEPSVKFISGAANSGNTMSYFMKLPLDPAKPATNTGSVVKYGELSIAPWFAVPLCDPNSYPLNPCTPDSDSNSGSFSDPNAAGSALMELQFYPPGFAPFADNISCSRTRWCVAMTIDSLEATFNFASINPNCTEPVNFAYLQNNGQPAGPPSPQLADVHTATPNSHTLMINPGDAVKVSITDPAGGFTATVRDLTTHRTGFMVASTANGFANTDPNTCAGTPFTFHAEYATAQVGNGVPWTALNTGVMMEQEIGHSEVCASLTHKNGIKGGKAFTDTNVFDTCVGGSEGGKKHPGEGSCNSRGFCQNPETEGTTSPIACPSRNAASGQLCEFADGLCFPQGTRTVTLLGHLVKETSPVNICEQDRFQNGDLDFDGMSYQKTTWPNGSPNVPTSFRYAGPFDSSGHTYPQAQFETDVAGSEFLCNVFDGLNCDAPPLGSHFYPFWTMTNKAGQGIAGFFQHACVWNFGNVIKNVTTQPLRGAAQYGRPEVARFGGNLISSVLNNPETAPSRGCPALTEPHV